MIQNEHKYRLKRRIFVFVLFKICPKITVYEVLKELNALSDKDYGNQMSRIGIHFDEAYGERIPHIRKPAN